MAQQYAIRSLEGARAYLAHPVLGKRLVDCCRSLLAVKERTARQILGTPDDLKLRSSMTLFSQACKSGSARAGPRAPRVGASPRRSAG